MFDEGITAMENLAFPMLPPTTVTVYRVSASIAGKFSIAQEFRSDDGWAQDGQDPAEAARMAAQGFITDLRRRVGAQMEEVPQWTEEPVLERQVVVYGSWELERLVDPTHGRIDQDIQDQVSVMNPTGIGQRVAMENTLQNRRERNG